MCEVIAYTWLTIGALVFGTLAGWVALSTVRTGGRMNTWPFPQHPLPTPKRNQPIPTFNPANEEDSPW